MNSRERAIKALNHQETDRVPIDFGSTPVTGISVSIVSKLREYYELDNKTPVKVIEPFQMLGEVADGLKEKLGVDFIGLNSRYNMFGFINEDWKHWQLFDGTKVLVPGKFNTEIEKDGSVLQYPEGDRSVSASARMPKNGFYFDSIIRQKPIDDSNLNIEDNLEEYKELTDEDLKYFEKEADYLYKNTEFAIVANFGGTSFGDIALVPAPSLKDPKGIRDVEEWYISIITRKNYIYEVFSRQSEIIIKNLEKFKQAVSNKINVLFISGTDFGTQRGPFISNELYIELYKPFHKKINDWIHKNTSWKTFMHSCGSIEKLIPEFISAGFDILNPVQLSAEGMDAKLLKEKYGKQIVFWGGGVDTQKTLPFGTKEEVIEEVTERLKIFSKNGGFIFNTIHNIQARTPIKNIVAMIETAKGFKINNRV
ncbi:MAG: uroporphyrinogen decarboxylase family protein [Candidatus Humimicrobiaceae bacterium]